jgi:endonuclease/exonuclease/phosphatase family metal-dependent hydrolase
MSTRRRIFVIAGLVLLLIFCYRFFAIYTVRSGECKPHPGGILLPWPPRDGYPRQHRPLVVVSYNIAGHDELLDGDHVRKLAEAINQIHPDIVGLQEVHRGTWQARFHDQLKELSRLTGMKGYFGPSYEQHGGAYGNAILTRADLVSAITHPLPSMGEPRTVIEALVRIDGAPITVYVAHLTAWGSLNASNRGEQLQCLAKHVRTSKYPYILMGDFNNVADAPELVAFRKEDAAQLCGADIGDTFHSLIGGHRRIDYIFADRGWACGNARVPHVGPSDHWPIVVDLFWHREDSAFARTAHP